MSHSRIDPHPSRRGFTLVEVLVTITIIGILMGIAIPAINAALDTARTAAIRTEIEGMSQALEAYKIEYGTYPPDFIDWSIVERHYRRAFPNISPAELNTLQRLLDIDPSNDTTNGAAPAAHDPTKMDRAEALVWSLGGFSSNPQQPFTGSGGPLAVAVGSQTGPSATYHINSARSNALFNFEQDQLTFYGTGTGAQEVNPAGGLSASNLYLSTDDDDLFLTYLSRAEKGWAPYVYFDSRTYTYPVPGLGFNGYSGNGGVVRPFISDQPVLQSGGTTFSSPSAALATWKFMKPDSFQILSAGLDGQFGAVGNLSGSTTPSGSAPVYFQYPTGAAIAAMTGGSTPGDLLLPAVDGYQEASIDSSKIDNFVIDNVTNFSSGTVGDDLE